MPRPRHRPTRAVIALALVVAASALATGSGPLPAAAGMGAGTGTGPAGQVLRVSPVDDLDPAGETVTVTGSGFDAAAGFDVGTDGLYVAFCVDNGPAQAPSPCVGGVDMAGGTGASRWVTNNPFPGTPSVPIAADGSFTTTIVVQRADEHIDCTALPAGKSCKVTVRRDHRRGGDRSQDVKVPVAFGDGIDPTAEVSVEPATGLDPAGDAVTVTGTGYPTAGPGIEVVYGPDPSTVADPGAFGASVTVAAGDIAADGSFTVELPGITAAYTGSDGISRDFGDGGGIVSTRRAGGAADPTGDWVDSVPVAFAGATVPASTTTLAVQPATVAVDEPVVITATVRAGDAPVTVGAVELRAGPTSLGTVTLGLDGRATTSVSFASPGARSITAAFLGSEQALPSASAAARITVTAAPAEPEPPEPEPPTVGPSGTGTGTGPNGQTLTATPVDDLDPAGTEVEVTGAGFDAAAGFDTATDGLYLGFCVDNGDGAQPTPCVGGADTEGASGSSRWVTNAPYQGVPADAVTPVSTDGGFATRITVRAADDLVDCTALPAGRRCVIVVRMDHRATADRSQDVKVEVCFAGAEACTVTPRTVEPAAADAPEAFAGYPITPAAATPVAAAPVAGTRTALAATGFTGRRLVGTGAALLLGGGVLVAWSRRRVALRWR